MYSRLVPSPASVGVSGNTSQRSEGRKSWGLTEEEDGESKRETEREGEVECNLRLKRVICVVVLAPPFKHSGNQAVLAGEPLCHHTLRHPLMFPCCFSAPF